MFAEVCRRYLADEQDFSEEVLSGLGITKRFENIDFDACVQEAADYKGKRPVSERKADEKLERDNRKQKNS